MKERPIIFNSEMVRAIFECRKTQTRRIMKQQPPERWSPVTLSGEPDLQARTYTQGVVDRDGYLQAGPEVFGVADEEWGAVSPFGQPGDLLIPAVPLPGYDKRYCVDVFGDVWSRAKGDWKRLSPGITSKGYYTVTPARNGRYATQLVHRMVCEAFYGPAPDGRDQVRHLNGNQADNSPENLDWGTQEQNWCDRAAHGGGMGENHHAAKLTLQGVAEIRKSGLSQRALAAKYGVSQSTIQSARVGDNWKEGLTPALPNMPRKAARILLEITDVRVERLNDISNDDAMAEGMDDGTSEAALSVGWFEKPRRAFQRLWAQIYGQESWDGNPWVWVVEFKQVPASAGKGSV